MMGLCKTAEGVGNLEYRDMPIPEPGEGQVLIEVRAAGICGSDLHIFRWDTQLPMNLPVIIGHEYSGVLSALGKGVKGWDIGERVTVEPSFSVCGSCIYCRTGSYNLCPERKVQGFWAHGAFTRYTLAPAHRLHRLPENVDFHEGALTEPLACCVHGVVELTGITVGELVVVSGPGTIGLFSLQLIRAFGGRVVVIGTSADRNRLKVARDLGAEYVLNLEEENPWKLIEDLSEGLGADALIECSGVPVAARTGLDLIRKGGRYTQIGLFGKPITIDFEKIAYKELRVTGSFAQRWTAWKKALDLVSHGEVRIKPLISDVMPLSRWQEAFRKFEAKEGLKILLEPDGR
jgi:L-iditol 2-dehydrogenase